MSPTPTPETITLAGGCFWCLEAVYERVRGVLEVESGYSNGQAERPNYEQVCSGDTGCAEVVRVRFDPGDDFGARRVEVKLASGETFKLAPGVKTSSYKAGDKVSVRFTEKNGAKTADQIMAARN